MSTTPSYHAIPNSYSGKPNKFQVEPSRPDKSLFKTNLSSYATQNLEAKNLDQERSLSPGLLGGGTVSGEGKGLVAVF